MYWNGIAMAFLMSLLMPAIIDFDVAYWKSVVGIFVISVMLLTLAWVIIFRWSK